MMKLGAGLSAVLAGILCGPVIVVAADPLSTDMPAAGMSPEAAPLIGAFAAGFIRPPTQYEARISEVTGDNQTTGNKRLLGSGERIFLELTKPHETAPGDKFTIYRRVKKVFHPAHGQYLGDLTLILGVVKVLHVTGSRATVKIERSYDAIFPGDGAMRQGASPQPAPASSGHTRPGGTGMIIEVPPGVNLIGQGHLVWLDWGRDEGMKLGDRLDVFREDPGFPFQIIGELQVIAVEDLTATARIVNSLAPFLRGDQFASKDTLQKLRGDAPLSSHERKEALFQDMSQPSPAEMLPGGDIPEFGKSK